LEEISKLRYPSAQTLAHRRILADVIDLLGRHGFLAGCWFSDFDFRPHLLSQTINVAQERLQAATASFPRI
jgi:hypothetical protein